jgi:arylsulfatase A-like enzyme
VVDDALNWIEEQSGPWMATVAFNAPHSPYHYPPADLRCHRRLTTVPEVDMDGDGHDDDGETADMYKAMLECLDHYTDVLLTGIDPQVLENTKIIFIGDNGTPPGNREGYGHIMEGVFNESPGQKGNAYRDGVHVPLIIADGFYLVNGTQRSCDGCIAAPGRVSENLVHGVDLFATAVELSGRSPHIAPNASNSLVSILAEESHDTSFRELNVSEWFTVVERVRNLYPDSETASVTECDMAGALSLRGERYSVYVDFSAATDDEEVSFDNFKLYDLEEDPNQLNPINPITTHEQSDFFWSMTDTAIPIRLANYKDLLDRTCP